MNGEVDGRRRVRVFAFAIALMFGALAFANWWTSRENLREGSTVVSRGGEPLEVTKIPTSYHAVFRHENRAGGKLIVTTERVWVRRPFQSRVETWRGTPPGGSRQTVRFSAFGILASTGSGGGEPLNITAPPGLSSGDLRFDAILDEAVRSRTILRRERREVFGRQCQVYRVGGPVLAGDVEPYEPGGGDYADACVDRNGIVIEEYWVEDEKPLRRRVATELEIDPPLDRNLFEIDIPENPKIDRGAVGRVTEDPPEGLWTFEDVPDGFERLGHYAVIRSSQTLPQTGGVPAAPPSSTTEVFVRGPDVLIVDQDPSLSVLANMENRPSRKVDLGRLRDGKLIIDARMSEVQGGTGDGSLVRVFGTLPTSELVELAKSLRPVED